ncbi:MAG TPA: AsmA family protein [Terriglobia bacterium]|nr:AsmA family protein [Terriglobia bacterium]
MPSSRRKYAIVAAVCLAVLAVLVLVVPRLVDVNRYRPQVAAYLESKTGKPVQIGRLNLTLFPHLAIQIDNFVMENPKGFPAGDFFKAQRIYALLEAGPLWNRKIVIRSLIVEGPVTHLICDTGGHWNFENPPTPASVPAKAPESGKPSFSLGTISQVSIDHGQATVANLLASGRMGPTYFDGQGLACRFQDVNINAMSAPGGDANSSAQAGSAGIVPAANNPSTPVAHGTFHADSLRFGAIQTTAVDAQIRLFPKQAYLEDLALKLAGGNVKGKAAADFSHPNLRYRAQTQFQKIDVAQLLSAFPSASGKMTGTMEGNFNLNGEAAHSANPLSGLQGTGQVKVQNGRMPSLQLNRNLLLLVRVAGVGASSGDPAAFSSVSTDLNLTNQRLSNHNVKIVSTDVNVDASGSVDLSGSNQMDYTGTALVPARQTGLTNLVAGLSGATYANGMLSFPFALQGTIENPRFVLKTGKGSLTGLSGASTSGPSQGGQQSNPIQNLINMFGKKKSTPPKP